MQRTRILNAVWCLVLGCGVRAAHAEAMRLPSPAEVAAFNVTGRGWASTELFGAHVSHGAAIAALPAARTPAAPPVPGVALGYPAAAPAWGSAALPVPASVVRSAKGKRFHRPGCTAARGQLAVVSLPEALGAGLSACQRCIDRAASLERRRARREAPRRSEALDAPPASGAAPAVAPMPPTAPIAPAATVAPNPTAAPLPASVPAATAPVPSETAAPPPAPTRIAAPAAPPSPATPPHGSEPHPPGTISSAPWDNPSSMLEATP